MSSAGSLGHILGTWKCLMKAAEDPLRPIGLTAVGATNTRSDKDFDALTLALDLGQQPIL